MAEAVQVWSSAEMKGRGKLEIPEKTRRPAACIALVGSEQYNRSASVAPTPTRKDSCVIRDGASCGGKRDWGSNGKYSAITFVRDPSQHSPGAISGNHGKQKSEWPDRESNPDPTERESSELPLRHLARKVEQDIRGLVYATVNPKATLDIAIALTLDEVVHYCLRARRKMTTVKQRKVALRKFMNSHLSDLKPDEVKRQSKIVTEKVLQHPKYIEAKSVSVYLSFDEEIDTSELLEDIFLSGKICYIPRVISCSRDVAWFHTTIICQYNFAVSWVCGGVVVRLLASHLDKPSSNPGRVARRFSHVRIIPGDTSVAKNSSDNVPVIHYGFASKYLQHLRYRKNITGDLKLPVISTSPATTGQLVFKRGAKEMEMMQLYSLEDLDNLPVNKHNIKQPPDDEYRPDVFEAGSLDVVLNPGLVFTKDGKRLGRGKAYYDKFLSKCARELKTRPTTLALAFKEQILQDIPTTDTDVIMDYVLYDDAGDNNTTETMQEVQGEYSSVTRDAATCKMPRSHPLYYAKRTKDLGTGLALANLLPRRPVPAKEGIAKEYIRRCIPASRSSVLLQFLIASPEPSSFQLLAEDPHQHSLWKNQQHQQLHRHVQFLMDNLRVERVPRFNIT
ncbi:hypothetical protein PR048_018011, partial [Dryococelus australis]